MKSADAFTREVCWDHPTFSFPPTWLEKEMGIPYRLKYLGSSSGNVVSPGAAHGPTLPLNMSLVGALHHGHGVTLEAPTAALLYSSSGFLLGGGTISGR